MTALTTKSIMLTKIVHRMCDCMGILRGSTTLMNPCRSIGGPDPCDPSGVDAYAGVLQYTWNVVSTTVGPLYRLEAHS